MQTNELPMVDVLRLQVLDGHRLWVRFTDGNEGVRDFSDILAQGGPMVEPLKAPDYFARAFVEMGAPTWPNGFDIDPIKGMPIGDLHRVEHGIDEGAGYLFMKEIAHRVDEDTLRLSPT